MTTCEQQLAQFASSRLCVLRDDVGDNRSVLVAPAHNISADEVNLIIATTGGLTFVAISPDRAAAFMLTPMLNTQISTDSRNLSGILNQYISVEAREGVSTGISSSDRATTISVLGAALPHPRALVKPGHIFPVGTKQGGSVVKSGIPEAALDIVTLAGFHDAALFVDFLNSRGDLISADAASDWALAHKLPAFTISEIIQYRLLREPLVARLSEANLPTREAGTVRAIAYRSIIHDVEHVALVKGDISSDQPVLVRVQVENTVADVFGGSSPASRQQIIGALRAIAERGSGVLLYLRRNSLAEHAAKVASNSISPATIPLSSGMREYGVGAQILRDLGISKIELISSTQKNLVGLDSFGISVVAQRPIPLLASEK